MERRKAVRFLLRVPVIFRWSDDQANPYEGTGFARDISTAGIFVMTEFCPPFGVAIDIEALLPPLQGSGQSLRLSGQGIVLRVTEKEGLKGFASTSDFASMAGETGTRPPVH